MAQPLTVYSFVPQQSHASYAYRVLTPLEVARDMGLPVKAIIDTNLEGIQPEERIKNFCEADIILLYQPIGDPTLHNIKLAKSFIPSMREGSWKYPPTVILDTDDNLLRVDPHNMAYKNLGWCNPETGKPIPKGQSIAHLENGVRKLLWHDGDCQQMSCGQMGDHPDCRLRIDVEKNRAVVDTYRQLLATADCVTCTTPRVVEAMAIEAPVRKFHVAPNVLRMADYPQIDLMKKGNQIRILWQGGANHFLDWLPLKDAVANITKKYPAVHWIMWGVDYKWVTEVIPPDRMTFQPWSPYHEYKLRRCMTNDDISLAPLGDTAFNRCRSAIKWYEASILRRPPATLAQDTGAYHDEIQDGETGLLFKDPQEFEDRLSLLIENPDERKRLGKNAKDWVMENRDATKEVPKLVRFWEQLREEAPYEQPHMPDSAWQKFEQQMMAQEAAQQQAQAAQNGQPKQELQPA